MKPITNKQIVGGFNRKEKWAFELIFRDYFAPVFELAARILKNDADAGDIASEIFLMMQCLDDRMSSIKDIRDTLFVSTKNRAIDKLRRRRLEENYISAQTEGIAEPDMFRNETGAAIYYEIGRCKQRMTPQVQRVFELHFIRQKSVLEIAMELHIDTKTVRNNKAVALRIMRLEMIPRKNLIFLFNLLP